MHAEKAQSVEERERELAGIASVLSKRSSLQFDEFFVELSLLGRKWSEQIVSDFGRKRGAENRRSGSTQNKLIGNARELGMSVESERTSADRMAANSRSASLQPLRRPASMGRTNSCRKEASEENTPGLTNSDSAKSSWRMRKTSLADFQIVLDGRAGEKNAATRGELEQTVDRGVAGGALETMALVADEKSGLAAIDSVGVFAIHLDEKESKQAANLIRNHQHDAIQSRLHHEIADLLFCLRSLLLQHDASNPIASNPLSTPHSSSLRFYLNSAPQLSTSEEGHVTTALEISGFDQGDWVSDVKIKLIAVSVLPRPISSARMQPVPLFGVRPLMQL